MHENVPVRFGRGRLDSLVTKGLAAYLIATRQSIRMIRVRLRQRLRRTVRKIGQLSLSTMSPFSCLETGPKPDMTVAIDRGNIVTLGEGIRVQVARPVAQIARRFGIFDG